MAIEADDKVLVERDGQFELVSTSDMTSTSKEVSIADFKHDELLTDDTAQREGVEEVTAPSQTPKDGCSSKNTPSFQMRTVSAPTRGTERDRLNQTAFETWLCQKNHQLMEQRKAERLKRQTSVHRATESERDKVFQNWLVNKKRQASAIAHANKEQDATESEEDRRKRNDLAFELWMKRKQAEKQQSLEFEKQRLRDLEETAKLTDPGICQKVYKQWLRDKLAKKKEEELWDKQCRKLFFKESKELRKTLSHRFQGF